MLLTALRALLLLVACLAGSAAGLAQGGGEAEPVPLPALGAALEQTSVSGLSSGAFMAGQFHIAHSRMVVGAAIVAGGPYACAEVAYRTAVMPWIGTVAGVAIGRCMLDNYMFLQRLPSTEELARHARDLAAAGAIDPLAQLAATRVYFFSGGDDGTVVPGAVAAARALYERLGVPASHLKSETRKRAGHAFITKDKGAACGLRDRNFITNCDYDQARDILEHLYAASLRGPRAEQPAARPLLFDQRSFTRDLADHGLDEAGFAYVAPDCRTTPGCRVHVVFHGCAQQRGAVGAALATDSGFANWADANRLIVLFPQVAARLAAGNPYACWDWWGYTGRGYLTREGAQMVAVRRMLERLAGR